MTACMHVAALTMTCPYCKREATIRVRRFATASPTHIDLECTCERCGEKWSAAEDTMPHVAALAERWDCSRE
jgi:hypothetical protein